MYFKKLEMVGFKSFANKTKLEFEPGVTAVVGPNGCGKSNIADAIKWVLGEQSPKSLRGSRMEDVIFNGTASQEPINMAEVSLTLTNHSKVLPIDYEEVTVTRRLFRSGESEYLLNKTNVRLKDISELLMGTGIGTESYSIIEQGKMDLILSSKPEERRFVFEEASGITKYKAKKKEALRKLEQTEQNLVRINDIINEVKRQLAYIERQANKAEKYKEAFEVLKDLELKHSFFEYRNLSNQDKTNHVESQDIRTQEKELSGQVSKFTQCIHQLRDNLDRVSHKLLETQQKSAEAKASFEKNRHRIELDKERIKELEASRESLTREIEEFRKKLDSTRKEAKTIREEFTNWEKQLAIKGNLIREKEAGVTQLQNEVGAHQHDIKTAKSKTLEFLTDETRIKNELIKLGTDAQNRRARLRRLSAEKENVNREKAELDTRLERINTEFGEKQGSLDASSRELHDLGERLKNMTSELEEASRGLIEKRKELEVLKSKEEMLKELARKREGFDRTVKEIHNGIQSQNPSVNGVVGILADMINVQPGFESCAECALGRMAQAVIVDTRQNAKNLTRFLKEKDLGDVILLIHEEIGSVNGRMPSLGKDVLPLSNFVTIKNGLDGVIPHLFKDTYVVPDEESAERIMLRYRHDVTLVTRDGIALKKGLLFAGLTKQEICTSVVGREERIKGIINRQGELTRDIDSLAIKEKEYTERIKDLRKNIHVVEKGARVKELELGNVASKKTALEDTARKLNEEVSVLDMEREEAQEAIDSAAKKTDELNKELARVMDESLAVQNLVTTSQDQITNKNKLRESIMLEIADIREERSSLRTHLDNVENNLKRQNSAVNDLESSVKTREEQVRQSAERCSGLGDEAVELEAQQQIIASEEKFLEKTKKELEAKKLEAARDLGREEGELRQKGERLDSLRNEIRDFDIKKAEISFKRDNLKNKIFQSYKVSLDEINPEIDERTDWQAVRQEIEERREKIEKMGPVNLVAIDEHKELEERHSFLTRQQEDLINAKESLHKAIVKINVTTKKLFMETFGKIQVEFKNYFRMLFGGGQAELVLLDEKDVLESGIEIVARPPGKKLQNILLLSGGEKALTAISLLFSIFRVKPSPFCVLDEIDAPLDEANVERFSRVLQEFLKISQFIIITHNKKTIQLADILYGITMEKKGVSNIVSVKLRDTGEKEGSRQTVFA